MFIIDYFVYKIYSLTRKFFLPGISYAFFPLLLFINIDTVMASFNYPIWNKEYGSLTNLLLICFYGVLIYVYSYKDRTRKVYEKYKNESTFWKVFGWILVGGYIVATFFLMYYL